MQYKYSASNEDKDLKIKQMAYLKQQFEKFKTVITVTFFVIIFFVIKIIELYFKGSIFSALNIIGESAFCFFIAKAFTVLIEIIFTSDWFYASIRKNMACPIKVHYIDTFNSEETKENLAPGIVVSFDIKEMSEFPLALVFELPQNRYYVVALISRNEIKQKLKLTITSEEVVAAIDACNKNCVSEEGYLTLNIMKCLKSDLKEGDIADYQMIDTSLKITEVIYLPLLKKEGSSN